MDISALRERPERSALTVTELNNYIKQRIDSDRMLSAVSVVGEISNFTDHRSGHLYFTLKDADSQIKAVMFKWQRARLKFLPCDGDRVVVHGSLSLYPQGGTLQIYVNSIVPDGVGELYRSYERLKNKLAEEGLFDESHKKLLPRFPSSIGVITSPTGAAIQDIINITRRRYPMAKIYLYPALVQGEGADTSLITALNYLDGASLVDVIIIGRGGGSIEDLWAFNSEALARRIFEAKTPIISAVGHETDYTICDFVSDRRAPTPSAAAELAVPDSRELYDVLDRVEFRLKNTLQNIAERKRARLERLSLENISELLMKYIEDHRGCVLETKRDAEDFVSNKLDNFAKRVILLGAKANALSPLATMERGYSLIEKNGAIIKKSSEISEGDSLKVRFADGSINVNVNNIKPG